MVDVVIASGQIECCYDRGPEVVVFRQRRLAVIPCLEQGIRIEGGGTFCLRLLALEYHFLNIEGMQVRNICTWWLLNNRRCISPTASGLAFHAARAADFYRELYIRSHFRIATTLYSCSMLTHEYTSPSVRNVSM